MKRFFAVFLALTMLAALTVPAFAAESKPGFGDYKHVYIIGVDGAGASYRDCDTPNFDRIFADNAFLYDGVAEYITTSAQNWGSILCGVSYDVHGFTNGYIEDNQRSSDTENNSIFYYARQKLPEAELVSFCHWNPINNGIIENDLGVRKIHRGTDPLVTQSIVNYFAAGNSPALMFVQLDEVDGAGHSYGGETRGYYRASERSDVYIGEIYDAIGKAGLLEDSLFIVVADHGESIGGGHGGQSKEESEVVVAVAGKNVNSVTLPAGTRNRDVAAIALYALGIEAPGHMTAKVPENLFGEEREKTAAKDNTNFIVKFFRDFANLFVKIVDLFAALGDGYLFPGC